MEKGEIFIITIDRSELLISYFLKLSLSHKKCGTREDETHLVSCHVKNFYCSLELS